MEAEFSLLAGVAASSVVTLLVTEGFGWCKARLGALLGRDRPVDGAGTEDVERLCRALLADRAAGDEPSGGVAEEHLTARFEELLSQRPELATELREIVHRAGTASLPPALAPRFLHYVNHEKVYAAMEAYWSRCADAEVSAVMFLVGLRGIGRRAAGRRWAREHADRFTGAVLSADLGRDAHGTPADPAAVLDAWLAELRVLREDRPAGLAAKSAAFRAACAKASHERGAVLILLDHVETRAQIEPLLPGTPGSAVLLTGQHVPPRLAASTDFEPLRVGPLHLDHAVELLAEVSGTTEARDRLRPLARSIGGNPWALRLVGAQLRSPDPDVLEDIGALLAHRDTRQEFWQMTDDDLYETFDLTYDRLAPKPAYLYRLLGLLPPGLVHLDVLYAVLQDWSPAEVRLALRELVGVGIVERDGRDACRLEPLVHDHALSRAEQDEDPAHHEELRDRFFAHVLEFAERGEAALSMRWLYYPAYVAPLRQEATGTDKAGVEEEFARRAGALVGAVALAHATGRHQHAWRLCQGLWSFVLRTARHTEWIESHRIGLQAALACLDAPMAAARMHFQLGFAHLDRFSLDEDDPRRAREHFEEALRHARHGQGGHPATEAEWRTRSSALEGLGLLALKLKHAEVALDRFAEAKAALDGVDHPRGHALLTFHTGRAYSALNRHNDAERELARARQEFEVLPGGPDRFNIAKTWLRQAEDRRACGQRDAALRCLDEADAGMAKVAADYQQAVVRLLRGDLHDEGGDRTAARADWAAARDLFLKCGSTRADEATRRLDA